MPYVDQRLGKILSDIRIEEARQIREQRASRRSAGRNLRNRLGLWLIARGEGLAKSKPRIA